MPRAWATSTRAGPTARDQRRHTDHDIYYARNAQTDGTRIVYQCGADIWLFDPATDRTVRVDIDVPSHRTQAARKFVAAADHLASFNVHPAGHSLALDARGKLFTMAMWEGAVHQHGAADGVRYRHGQWLADGKSLVAVSDETGEERIVVVGDGKSTTLPWDVGRVLALRAAPTGQRSRSPTIATKCCWAISPRRNSRSSTAATRGAATTSRGRPMAPGSPTRSGPIRAPARSSCTTSPKKTSTLVTQPEFRDYSPAFDPEGKYLYFLSVRTFDPVYDSVQFELCFPRAARPYLIALRNDQRPPFDPEPKGLKPADDRRKQRQAGSRRPRFASTSPASRAASPHSRCRKAASDRSPARRARCCGRCSRFPARTVAADTRSRPAGWNCSISRRCAPRRCSSAPTISRSPPTM